MKSILLAVCITMLCSTASIAQDKAWGSAGTGLGFHNKAYPQSTYNVMLRYSSSLWRRVTLEMTAEFFKQPAGSSELMQSFLNAGFAYHWISSTDLQVYSRALIGYGDNTTGLTGYITPIGARSLVSGNFGIYAELHYGNAPLFEAGILFKNIW
ncbi:hypothetical protein GC194_03120 [bacterium]|nr:hypothetical protein [bacterium]